MKVLTSTTIFFAFWFLLTRQFSLEYVVIGLMVSLLGSYFYGYTFNYSHKFLEIKRYLLAIYYLLFLLKECALACIKVGLIILKPKVILLPGVVKLKTKLQSNLTRVILANSITLTPGTLTVHLKGEDLYIHKLHLETMNKEELRESILGKFERILIEVFE